MGITLKIINGCVKLSKSVEQSRYIMAITKRSSQVYCEVSSVLKKLRLLWLRSKVKPMGNVGLILSRVLLKNRLPNFAAPVY